MFAKRILKSLVLLSAAVILAACGGMGSAHAQTQPNLFKSQAGKVFNIDASRSVQYSGGYLVLDINTSTTSSAIADGTGAVYQALQVNPYFLSKFVRAGTSQRWLNTDRVLYAECSVNQTYTTVYWSDKGTGASYNETVADGNCSTFFAIQAKAN